MKKIIIKTSQQGPDYFFLALLNRLFPDCEIQIEKEGDYILGCNELTINWKETPCKTINEL